MGRKANRNGQRGGYSSNAGRYYSQQRPFIDNKTQRFLLEQPEKWQATTNSNYSDIHAQSAQQPYSPTNFTIDTPPSFVTPNRGYAMWTHVDDEAPEDKKHAKVFIRLQESSAGGVAATGLLGGLSEVFTPIGAAALVLTGGANVARNEVWWQSIQKLPQKLGTIVTYPTMKTADIFYDLANFLPDPKKEGNKAERRKATPKTTDKIRQWLLEKGKSLEKQGNAKRKAIDKFVSDPIGRDIIETKISITALGAGAIVHIPQTLMGWNMYQQSGELNGHLTGAGIAGGSYALAALMKLPELPRLRDMYNRYGHNPGLQWGHEQRHAFIGYSMRGEHLRDAATMLPIAGFTYKGIAYMGETTHIFDWGELIANPPDLAQSQIAASLSSPSWDGLFQALTMTDFSNVYNASASLCIFAAGAAFAGSGIYEFTHQHADKVKYMTKHFVTDPITYGIHYMKDAITNKKQYLNRETPKFVKKTSTPLTTGQKAEHENHAIVADRLSPNSRQFKTQLAFPEYKSTEENNTPKTEIPRESTPVPEDDDIIPQPE